MAKRASREEVLAAGREQALAKPPTKRLKPLERHLRDTFSSLIKVGRRGSRNPRFVSLFGRDYGWFRRWSLSERVTLDHELELLGEHVLPNTRLVKNRVPCENDSLPDWYTVIESEVVAASQGEEIPSECWVKDFEDARWVKRDDLKRRKKKFTLTSYGHGRMKERREPLRLTVEGETKSASAWAKDPRCSVSDKTIALRKAKGWSDPDAVLMPRASQGKSQPCGQD